MRHSPGSARIAAAPRTWGRWPRPAAGARQPTRRPDTMALSVRTAAPAALVAAAMVMTSAATAPAPGSPQQVLADAVSAYTALVPMPGGTVLDAAQAAEVQRMLILTLRPRFGEIAGYKAALTSPAAQQRFGVDGPLAGVLLENMFTSTGSIV